MNQFNVIATLAAQAELRHHEDNRIANAFVLIPFDKEGEAPNRVKITAWNKTADQLMLISEGSMLLLSGTVSTRAVERMEGHKETVAEMTVQSFQLIEVLPMPAPQASEAESPKAMAATA